MRVFRRIFEDKARRFPHLYASYDDKARSHADIYKDESDEDDEDIGNAEVSKGESIERVYGDSVVKYNIFRDDPLRCFYVTDNLREVYDMLINSPPRSLHGIALGGAPQKIAYDIDMPMSGMLPIHNDAFGAYKKHEEIDALEHYIAAINDDLTNPCAKFLRKYMYGGEERIKEGTNATFRDKAYTWAFVRAEFCIYQLLTTISKMLPSVPIVKCESHGEHKYSYHIVVCAYARNYEEAHYYAMKIYDAITVSYVKPFIDLSIYKSVQNLRTCYSYKYDETATPKYFRRKTLSNDPSGTGDDFENWKMSLVGYIDTHCVALPHMQECRTVEKPFAQPTEYSGLATLPIGFAEIINEYSVGLVADDVNGSLVVFKRVHPSHCVVCKTKERGQPPHEHDNSLMVIIHKDSYILKCRRNRYKESFTIRITSERSKLNGGRRIDKKISAGSR